MTDVALLLFCSYVIACPINPFVDKMSQKMPRAAAVSIMIILITLVTLGVFIPIIVMSVNEIREFLNQLPQQIQNIQHFLDTFKVGGQDISQYLNIDTVLDNSANIAKEVIDKSINFTLGIVGVLTILVTIGIIVFFLSNDRKEIKEFSLKLFPKSLRERASQVIDDLETKVGGYVAFPKGWIICTLAIGSLLLGQFIENNWAKPYFFSKYMDLHPLVVIFSFVVAAKFLGVVGVLIAPAIAAVVVTLFEEIYVKTMNDENESTD